MTKEKAIEIIKELCICEDDDSRDIRKKVLDHALSSQMTFSHGVSKMCIIFKNTDFVIKWSPNNYYNEALKEVETYNKAKSVRLEMFFPHTELIGEINGVKFVLQQKIDFSVSGCSQEKEKKYQKISATVKNNIVDKMTEGFHIENAPYNRIIDITWAKLAIALYGKTVCKKLCDFIQENKINDLHNENIGYKNNKPIILDFSGYFR